MYINYYKNEAQKEVQNSNGNKTEVVLSAQKFFSNAIKIRQLDSQNKIEGIVYDVPLYKQGNHQLCWAHSQIMVENTGVGDIMTQKQADIRARQLGTEVNGLENWDNTGFPTNALKDKYGYIKRTKITNSKQLEEILKNEPQYAEYADSEKGIAHLTVVAGCVSAEGLPSLVVQNDPNGYVNTITFTKFSSSLDRGIYENLNLKFTGIVNQQY